MTVETDLTLHIRRIQCSEMHVAVVRCVQKVVFIVKLHTKCTAGGTVAQSWGSNSG